MCVTTSRFTDIFILKKIYVRIAIPKMKEVAFQEKDDGPSSEINEKKAQVSVGASSPRKPHQTRALKAPLPSIPFKKPAVTLKGTLIL